MRYVSARAAHMFIRAMNITAAVPKLVRIYLGIYVSDLIVIYEISAIVV